MENDFSEQKLRFHPTDPPHGMRNFDLGALRSDQQQALNQLKMKQRWENEIYLNLHPEIRALVSLLLRHILTHRPLVRIHEVVGEFFNRKRSRIAIELLDYLIENCYPRDVVNAVREAILKYDDSSDDDSVECVRSRVVDDDNGN